MNFLVTRFAVHKRYAEGFIAYLISGIFYFFLGLRYRNFTSK